MVLYRVAYKQGHCSLSCKIKHKFHMIMTCCCKLLVLLFLCFCRLICQACYHMHHVEYVSRVMRKQTLRSLSLSYQKKDGHAWPTFREYNLWCQQSQILKSQCHTKRNTHAHPSFGMSTTKTLRFVFSWHVSCVFGHNKQFFYLCCLSQAW